jgi:hypothetical protein
MQQQNHHFLLDVKLMLDIDYTVVVIAIDVNRSIIKIGMMPKQHVKAKALIWQLLEAKTNLIL